MALTSHIGKPTTLAAATAPTKSADGEAVVDAPAGPARSGSSSSSSSESERKRKSKKAAKSRSRSNKRASLFGGLLGKKDKAEEKVEQKKDEHEATTAVPEVRGDEPVVTTHIGTDNTPSEVQSKLTFYPLSCIYTNITLDPTVVPVVAEDAPKAHEEVNTETPAPISVVIPTEETAATAASADASPADKPKVQKRGSVFGTLMGKLKSPTAEKKENDIVPAVPAKDAEALPEVQKPIEGSAADASTPVDEASAPLKEATLEAPKTEDTKPVPAVTPSKEKEHFSFGKLFGGKEKVRSPTAETTSKVQESAPQIEDTTSPTSSEPAPALESPRTEPTEQKEEAPVVKKRSSIFGSLIRSASKAGGKKDPKEKKEAVAPATVPETTEPKDADLVDDVQKDDTAAAPATIGDVVPDAVTVGQDPKSSTPVTSAA